MRSELEYVAVLRLHTTGDFYSNEYTRKWQKILAQTPATEVFAYTRSWVVPQMAEEIYKLAALPNMWLWLSFDKTMPTPPVLPNLRRCYLSEDEADLPPEPVDLVFRSGRAIPASQMNLSPVCPHERDRTPRSRAVTCQKCKLCFTSSSRLAELAAKKVTIDNPALVGRTLAIS
jgi:hypothetical protein